MRTGILVRRGARVCIVPACDGCRTAHVRVCVPAASVSRFPVIRMVQARICSVPACVEPGNRHEGDSAMAAAVPAEILQGADEGRWVSLNPGIAFRLLFSSGETGRWTVLFRCQPGSFIPRHKHYGAGEYFVVK